jgi:hypothetical protein
LIVDYTRPPKERFRTLNKVYRIEDKKEDGISR